MIEVKRNFIKIMQLELEDLHMDIEALIHQCEKGKENGKITNYVFLENLAVFKNELLGLNVFGEMLDSIDVTEFDSLDDMIQYLKEAFNQKINSFGLVEAINVYVERKLMKVARYVMQ